MTKESETSPEISPELSPKRVFELILTGQIQSFEISLCAQKSSIEIVETEGPLLLITGLDYNSWLVNSYRAILQDLPEHPQIRTCSEHRDSISLTKELEILDNYGEIYHADLTSAGISNKFNRLKFTRLPW